MLLNLCNLKNLLFEFSIDTQSWGKEQAKSVEDLFEEIAQGESQLRIDVRGISRVVEIVRMFVCDPNSPERGYLLEMSQCLPGGQIRERKRCPAGKLRQGESPEEAVVRELKEELKIERDGCQLSLICSKLENAPSPSYPGLPCYYAVHEFRVVLKPDSYALKESFTTTEEDGTFHIFGWGEPKVG
jgi:hypothetical protein